MDVKFLFYTKSQVKTQNPKKTPNIKPKNKSAILTFTFYNLEKAVRFLNGRRIWLVKLFLFDFSNTLNNNSSNFN